MLHKICLRAVVLGVAAAGMAGAHLSVDGFKPAAGATVNIGSTFVVTWKELNNHAKGTNIDLSEDGGKTWSTIKANFADNLGTNTFNWTVAGTASETAKLRICQHEGTPVAGCRDMDNTNALTADIAGNYFMISGMFTLSTPAGVLPVPKAAGFSLGIHPVTGGVDAAGRVVVPFQAGKEVQTPVWNPIK